MSNSSPVEEIKRASRGLRGHIAEELAAGGTHFSEESAQLLKFHGSYQQDDRDTRALRKKEGKEKDWIFMIRTKIAGGELSVEQYLAHDRMADELGNGSIRLTNRQGIQMHGVLFGSLKDCIRRINACGLTTRGACGDIVRNTMATAIPLRTAAIEEAQRFAALISETFFAKTRAYTEIWLDGEKITEEEAPDPFYGDRYLPRKYKIGVVVPPWNDIDVLTQDTGMVAHLEEGRIVGYTITVGGGFGMSFGQAQTHPCLAHPLLYVSREHALDALKAVVSVQRDYGRRDDRKQARLKYLIRDRGLDWFRERVLERVDFPTEPPRPVRLESVEDMLGWHPQGDGRFFYGLWIPQGRIRDTERAQWRSAIREVCRVLAPKMRISPNTNLYFYDLEQNAQGVLKDIFERHGLPRPEGLTRARRVAHACVALPTCGLALAESERVFSNVMEKFDAVLDELGLREEPLLIRMSGCPNGCSRPYNADIAFVGRAPGKYAIYMGGSVRGDRLAGLFEKSAALEDLISRVRPVLEDFARHRQPGESFSDFFHRTREPGEAPAAEQFHLELAERQKRLEAAKGNGHCVPD